MTRRYPPEEPREPLPLFDWIDPARQRGHDAAQAASGRAEKLEPGWRTVALEVVREYARTHPEPFLFQDIPLAVPDDADNRAKGALAVEARRRGWIESDGFGTDDWGSAKSRWRSLIAE